MRASSPLTRDRHYSHYVRIIRISGIEAQAGFDESSNPRQTSPGGAFAAMGAGGSLRHLVPADEPGEGRSGTPSVLLPELLVYTTGKVIADRYANAPAPRCSCQVCDGASLDRFNSKAAEVRIEALAHNAAVWTERLAELLDHGTAADRQRWWRAVWAMRPEPSVVMCGAGP